MHKTILTLSLAALLACAHEEAAQPSAERDWEKGLDGTRGPHFSSNILSLEAASQKLGVALALRPLIDADLKSGRLCAPFEIELKPHSAYYLVCPEVIAERPAVVAFRKWLLDQAQAST